LGQIGHKASTRIIRREWLMAETPLPLRPIASRSRRRHRPLHLDVVVRYRPSKSRRSKNSLVITILPVYYPNHDLDTSRRPLLCPFLFFMHLITTITSSSAIMPENSEAATACRATGEYVGGKYLQGTLLSNHGGEAYSLRLRG
jgi:hypothetical protein